MTFQNVQAARVMQAVAIVFGVSVVLSFLASCAMLPLMSSGMLERFSDLLGVIRDPNVSPEQLQSEVDALANDFGPELNLQYGVQWALAAAVTFSVARRVARGAESPEQAAGYGLLIGLGTAFTYGVLCVMCSIALLAVRVVFWSLLVAAGALGGQLGGQRLAPAKAKRAPEAGWGSALGMPLPPTAARPTGNPEIYYNMGVMAAQGGRPDEARQHFTRALQMQPRHVAAWLQLANLADTPEQAWNYIQQARLISPSDPAVQQAVEVIWPKVAASARQAGPPRNQPPYAGGALDDVAIPRTTLPGGAPPLESDRAAPGEPPPDTSEDAASGPPPTA